MFERFTESARRAVFFARYEASQYGSSYIDTEHLLLGLWREDLTVRRLLKDTELDSEVRREIEKTLVSGQPIPFSNEVPLSADAKRALILAAEEADRFGQRQINTEQMLLGLLRIDGSVGAQIIRARGVRPEDLREVFSKSRPLATPKEPALSVLDEFLTGLKWRNANHLMGFFAENAQMVDVFGKRWQYSDICSNFGNLFAPYAKKNATYIVEDTAVDSGNVLVVVALWKNALVASMERVWMHRMTVVLSPVGDHWAIVSVQTTPVRP